MLAGFLRIIKVNLSLGEIFTLALLVIRSGHLEVVFIFAKMPIL